MTFEFAKRRQSRDTRNLDGRESVHMNLHSIIQLSFGNVMARKPIAG